MNRMLPSAAALLAALLLSACAGTGREAAALRTDAAERLGIERTALPSDAAALQARIDELLARPLDREDAVVVALLGNPALQRRYAELEISAAERLAAARPPNPSLTVARLERGSETETERGIAIDLIGLLTWPLERGMADRRHQAERQAALRDALTLARDVRVAWVEAVAADMHWSYALTVWEAADTAREYAQRLADTGNGTQLDSARAAAFHAEADGERLRARAEALAAREKLVRLLGIADGERLQLPGHLPALPERLPAATVTEQEAIDRRLDVQAARRHAEATARAWNLQRVTRFVNVLEVGYQSNESDSEPTQTGFEVTLELPLFDFGVARGRQARAQYEAALAGVRETAVNARSEVRTAWTAADTAWLVAARYRDRVLPLQEKITEEVLLRFNGMLVGPFEVIEQGQQQAEATLRAQQALRDFWIAEAELASARQ
ncbi:MAG: TolC family protein [Pseudomonadota bacterium]